MIQIHIRQKHVLLFPAYYNAWMKTYHTFTVNKSKEACQIYMSKASWNVYLHDVCLHYVCVISVFDWNKLVEDEV